MTNKEYWEEREKERLELIDSHIEDQIKKLKILMDAAINKIENDIYKLYQKYGKDNKMSYQEVLSYLSNDDRKEFQKDLKDYIETFKDDYKAKTYKSELQALSTRARIKRLEVLQANMKIQATELEKLLNDQMPIAFNDIYQDSYFYNLFSQCLYTNNLGVRFDIPSPNIVNELLRRPWSGSNYSDKVWNLTNNFTYKLDKVVTVGLIRGEHPKVIARNLKDAMVGKSGKGGKLYEYERLVRTEAAFIAEQATMRSYTRNNVEEYEYLATLDLRTSLICQDLDGKVFKVKDAVTGVNYPPMHPHCRSTTVPVIKWDEEDDGVGERIARDPIAGRNNYIDDIDYPEWKDEQYDKYGKDEITSEEKRIRNRASDKRQHKKYLKELGDIVPQNFTKFQDLKYNNKDEWDRLSYNYKLETVYNLDRLKHTENFASKNIIKHILEGEVNRRGKAVGFHMENMPTAKGSIIESTRSKLDKNGIYNAKVKVNGVIKEAKSSFFPTNMTPQQVVNAINEAYENREQHFIKSMMKGKTNYGFEIGMYLDKNDKITTAFPLKE